MKKEYKLYINGEWIDSSSGDTATILNPADESIVGTVADATADDAHRALAAARDAQPEWGRMPAIQRAQILRRFTDLIRQHKEALADLLTREQGKLRTVAGFEVDVTCSFIEYACDWARHIEGDIVPSDNPDEYIFIHKVPKGVVVAITAWNFPLALAGRKIGPALITGNAVVVKPTPDAPLSTLALCELATQAGIPAGVLNMVTGGIDVGRALTESPITKMITMTGSTPTGQAIARSAATHLTHVQLELGGKAPCIVFEDADIDQAVAGAFHSRFDNCGQVCTCNERMYVHEEIYEAFMEKFLEKTNALKLGDPFDPNTDIGPKMNIQGVTDLERIVAQAIDQGATVLTGGARPAGAEYEKGYWYQPTILGDVTQDMTVVHEEVFGPVLPVIKFSSYQEVIDYANDSEFGLAAMVFTQDHDRIMNIHHDLECGEIYINRGHGEQHQGFHNGLKKSGSGGEDGRYGIEQYLEKKSVYIKYKRS